MLLAPVCLCALGFEKDAEETGVPSAPHSEPLAMACLSSPAGVRLPGSATGGLVTGSFPPNHFSRNR